MGSPVTDDIEARSAPERVPDGPSLPGQADLVLGLDIGGTSTRALVIDRDGNRLGTGRAAGANITSHAADHALSQIRIAVSAAVENVDAAAVRAAVIGSAGGVHLAQPDVAPALEGIWHDAGLTCGYHVVPDAEVAFAAGTSSPDGTLLLAGTGAIAARITDGQLSHIVDGHGWLLGDYGSGFYLGREAVRATLRIFDERREPGPLTQAVLDKIFDHADVVVERPTVAELVRRVHAVAPVKLSEYAPLVSEYAGQDADAARIINDAAGHLIDSARLVRSPGETTPLVLAGGLLIADTPLATAVRRGITGVWPSAEFGYARDGAAGAAWMAATSLGPVSETARTTLFT